MVLLLRGHVVECFASNVPTWSKQVVLWPDRNINFDLWHYVKANGQRQYANQSILRSYYSF